MVNQNNSSSETQYQPDSDHKNLSHITQYLRCTVQSQKVNTAYCGLEAKALWQNGFEGKSQW